MLVDSHCHLDFPDFADDIDGIVKRAREKNIGRMVTISTRVRRLDELLAITERFADVFCSVGTHPHHAREELDITAADLVAYTRHPKVVAVGEAGLDYHYDNSPRDAQEQGLRAHIAAARETGLPLVIHSRDDRRGYGAEFGGRNREGRLPGCAALFHRRPRSCDARCCTWTLCVVLRNPDFQELAAAP